MLARQILGSRGLPLALGGIVLLVLVAVFYSRTRLVKRDQTSSDAGMVATASGDTGSSPAPAGEPQPGKSAQPDEAKQREKASDVPLVPGPCHPTFPPESERLTRERQRMVELQLRARDISDAAVLTAMERVPRHEFVPPDLIHEAYDDHPLPIGHQQTISQPYIVALMTQLARPRPEHRALDIGTGSGYQAAVLAELCREVYSVEIIEPLAEEAAERLKRLGYTNVVVRAGDGYRGWPEKAPFDVIIVAAAPDHVPQPLIDQLAPGGRLVIPVGRFEQSLLVIEKRADGSIRKESVAPVLFVPMTGEAQQRRASTPAQ